MNIVDQIKTAIAKVAEGYPTQYISCNGKKLRVSDHGANPVRVDNSTISIVVANAAQSYCLDRNRMVPKWERTNQWYVDAHGCFAENFESIEQFVEHFNLYEEST